jgi:hypothetical protein
MVQANEMAPIPHPYLTIVGCLCKITNKFNQKSNLLVRRTIAKKGIDNWLLVGMKLLEKVLQQMCW